MLDTEWLAAALQSKGLVSHGQVEEALATSAGDLCRGLVSTGAIEETALLRFLGLHFQTRYISTSKLGGAKIVQWVLDLLPMAFAEEQQVLPVRCDKQRTTLSIVTTDPSDANMLQMVRRFSGVENVLAFVGLPHAVEAGVRKFYRGDIHAFARMDESLRQDFTEMLNIYEQRLIDFDESGAPSVEEQSSAAAQHFRHDEMVLDDSSSEPGPASTSPAPDRKLANNGEGGSASAAPSTQFVERLEGLTQIISVLVGQLEQDCGWMTGHSLEVARLASQLAPAGTGRAQFLDIRLTALLHELGKPFDRHLTLLSIIDDPDLRQRAQETYKTPVQLLSSPRIPNDLNQNLATLYEFFEGGGVPGLLTGEAIPLATRLVQVADAYLDLVANPDAPGGPCSPEDAGQRLQDAAEQGLLDPATVERIYAPNSSEEPGEDAPLVLILDPDGSGISDLQQALHDEGFASLVAADSKDAALLLLGENVSLVLSEVDLQPMDGFAFLEWMHNNEHTKDVPLIFVSNRAEADDINRGFELGALDYIVKPFRPQVLLAKIKRLI